MAPRTVPQRTRSHDGHDVSLLARQRAGSLLALVVLRQRHGREGAESDRAVHLALGLLVRRLRGPGCLSARGARSGCRVPRTSVARLSAEVVSWDSASARTGPAVLVELNRSPAALTPHTLAVRVAPAKNAEAPCTLWAAGAQAGASGRTDTFGQRFRRCQATARRPAASRAGPRRASRCRRQIAAALRCSAQAATARLRPECLQRASGGLRSGRTSRGRRGPDPWCRR
jgi:hypothetical protein